MISKALEKSINQQINHELMAAYNYLGMSLYFEEENLSGFASWMKHQYEEEQAHAMRLLTYLQDRGGKVELSNLTTPKTDFNSPLAVFEAALEQEVSNTNSINSLYALAKEHNDYATQSHLQWFLDEQVEEEKSMEDIIGLLKRIKSDTAGLLYLNDKMSERKDSE